MITCARPQAESRSGSLEFSRGWVGPGTSLAKLSRTHYLFYRREWPVSFRVDDKNVCGCPQVCSLQIQDLCIHIYIYIHIYLLLYQPEPNPERTMLYTYIYVKKKNILRRTCYVYRCIYMYNSATQHGSSPCHRFLRTTLESNIAIRTNSPLRKATHMYLKHVPTNAKSMETSKLHIYINAPTITHSTTTLNVPYVKIICTR